MGAMRWTDHVRRGVARGDKVRIEVVDHVETSTLKRKFKTC
jgi:hypothetical protein